MRDSKEKEHRISNLKGMIDNINEIDAMPNEDIEEDSELINYLNQEPNDYEELEIDDEFIYRPNDNSDHAINLEETPIDEDFIIKTPSEKEIENSNKNSEAEEVGEEMMGEISENFDVIVNAKIGRTSVLSIISTFLGLILIVVSAIIFQSRSDRVIDHVASGETNFIAIIVLALGLLFFIYGIFKVFNLRNPFKSITDSIDTIDHDKKENTTDDKEEDTQVIPKSNIPLDKDAYKVGEFNMEEIKNKLKKPTASQNKTQPHQEDFEDIPPAKEKDENKKGLTQDEIEEMEYEQVQLENESIDDIFAEVEDIDEMPIISIDSEKK